MLQRREVRCGRRATRRVGIAKTDWAKNSSWGKSWLISIIVIGIIVLFIAVTYMLSNFHLIKMIIKPILIPHWLKQTRLSVWSPVFLVDSLIYVVPEALLMYYCHCIALAVLITCTFSVNRTVNWSKKREPQSSTAMSSTSSEKRWTTVDCNLREISLRAVSLINSLVACYRWPVTGDLTCDCATPSITAIVLKHRSMISYLFMICYSYGLDKNCTR